MRKDGYHDHIPSDKNMSYNVYYDDKTDSYHWEVYSTEYDIDSGDELVTETVAEGFAQTEKEAQDCAERAIHASP